MNSSAMIIVFASSSDITPPIKKQKISTIMVELVTSGEGGGVSVNGLVRRNNSVITII